MTRRRARNGRMALLVGLCCLLAAGLGVAAFPVASGWTAPPALSRSLAGRALGEARAAGAGRWATAALAAAEEQFRGAEAEYRRQELRLLPLRDFRDVRNRFVEAEQAAGRARQEAVESRGELAGAARAAVKWASCVVGRTEKLYLPSRLGGVVGEQMRASELALHEAESLVLQEEFSVARLRADEAVAQAAGVRAGMRTVLARFVDSSAVGAWREAQSEAIARSRATGGAGIVVNKDRATLTLYRAGDRLRTYGIEIGRNQLERKRVAGDRATPEGTYRVTVRRQGGQTRYYKALDLDYPNAEDRRRLAQEVERGALPAGARAGGWIEIHGEGGRGWDWTDGCIALTNRDLDDLFQSVPSGTPVTIIGGDGEGGRFSTLAQRLAAEEIEDDCRGD